MAAREVVRTALLSVVLLVVQVVLAPLPNIELVSVLIIVYAVQFGRRALYAVYVFVLLQGLIYGFGIWWVSYLYVWLVLFTAAYLFRKNDSLLFWAFINGAFGLSFGALTAIPYFFAGGFGMGISYMMAGIPFDIFHCIGNFVSALLLYIPLKKLFKRWVDDFEARQE